MTHFLFLYLASLNSSIVLALVIYSSIFLPRALSSLSPSKTSNTPNFFIQSHFVFIDALPRFLAFINSDPLLSPLASDFSTSRLQLRYLFLKRIKLSRVASSSWFSPLIALAPLFPWPLDTSARLLRGSISSGKFGIFETAFWKSKKQIFLMEDREGVKILRTVWIS